MIKNQFKSNSNYNNIFGGVGDLTSDQQGTSQSVNVQSPAEENIGTSWYDIGKNIDDAQKRGVGEIILEVTGLDVFTYDRFSELMLIIFLIALIVVSISISDLYNSDYEKLTQKENPTLDDLKKIDEVTNKANNATLVVIGSLSLFVFTLIYEIHSKDTFFKNVFNYRSFLNLFNDIMSNFNVLEVNSIIVEVQKKKIRSINDLNQIIQRALKSNQKTILLAIYNNQNQRRYIGVKLD